MWQRGSYSAAGAVSDVGRVELCEVIPQPGSAASISCWEAKMGTPPPNSALARRLHPNPGENSPCSLIPSNRGQVAGKAKRPARKSCTSMDFYFVGVKNQLLSFRVSGMSSSTDPEDDIWSPPPSPFNLNLFLLKNFFFTLWAKPF